MTNVNEDLYPVSKNKWYWKKNQKNVSFWTQFGYFHDISKPIKRRSSSDTTAADSIQREHFITNVVPSQILEHLKALNE